MRFVYLLLPCLCFCSSSVALEDKATTKASITYEEARQHEIKPHRREIPLEGVDEGFNQLHLTLIVSPNGEVIDARADGDKNLLKLWPQVESEVRSWKFTPFEESGKAGTVEVEEYLDLRPPEVFPKTHIKPPAIKADSDISITLARTGCYGTCPSYKAVIGNAGIEFNGGRYVVAAGKHTASVDRSALRELAKKFIKADFYSMKEEYRAGVTDCPTYLVAIRIDGREKKIEDYVGSWVGMPQIITELEDDVDELAETGRWIRGEDGLVAALQAEKYDFKTFAAQAMLKAVSEKGDVETVRDLLEGGVPLKPFPAPKAKSEYERAPYDRVGWLNAASRHPEVLQILIDSGASKEDQSDKDLALVSAAQAGNVKAAQLLLAYGADPNADLSKDVMTESHAGMGWSHQGAGSLLYFAAESGNPEMVKLFLSFHPNVNQPGKEGKTALFAAGESRGVENEEDRAECVRLLVASGANIDAQDKDGNTPLHGTYLTAVEKELLKLGADVNARNKDGETPIFTNVDDDLVPLLEEHAADLSIRNNKGQSVLEAAEQHGPRRVELVKAAIAKRNAK